MASNISNSNSSSSKINYLKEEYQHYLNLIKDCADSKLIPCFYVDNDYNKVCVKQQRLSKSNYNFKYDVNSSHSHSHSTSTGSSSSSSSRIICDLILIDQNSIFNAFKDAYRDGIDCDHFQISVNKVFESQKDVKLRSQCPNFIQMFTSRWMSYLNNGRKSGDFNLLLLPGTHNSCANRIMWQQRPLCMSKGSFVCCKLPVVQKIVFNWTANQVETLADQFKNGVRLFDIRVAKNESNEIYISHTFLLCKFSEFLQQIKYCLDTYPTEVITINIKIDHPYKPIFTIDDLRQVFQEVEDTVGPYIIPIKTSIDSLNQLLSIQKRLVVYCNLDQNLSCTNALIRVNKSHELWPNETTCEKMIEKLKKQLEFSQRHFPGSREFTYMSFNTTVDAKSVVKGIFTMDSNIKMSKCTQKCLKTFLNEQNYLPSGIIIDSPTQKSIQQILFHNFINDTK